MDLKKIDFNNVNFNEIGIWPSEMKVIAFIAVLLSSFVAGYFLILQEPVETLTIYIKKEEKKKREFKNSYYQAVNLDAYKKQMVEMEGIFRKLIRQLPSDERIPELLEELSQQASISGVRLILVKPQVKLDLGFYGELPIEIHVSGNYHGLGKFVDNISKLSRIVTLHDFMIEVSKEQRIEAAATGDDLLEMKVLAKTYWSIDKGGRH